MRKLALIATISLTCLADAAWALGVGSIELYSALNQPLQAEIPLFSLRAGESSLVNVAIAPDSAFARAGRERADILSNLRFRVVPGPSPDRAVIQVTTLQPVREPFLSMMLEVSWPEGRLVREYTLLLDPPGIAQAQSKRRPSTEFSQAPITSPLAGATRQAPPAARSESGSYGPVQKQETLWSIAYANRPSDSVSMDQMMQAIYEANPEAFDGDITRIRAGSMLRIPNMGEIRNATPADTAQRSRQRPARESAPAPKVIDDTAGQAPVQPSTPKESAAQAPTQPKGELRLSTPEETAATTDTGAAAATDDTGQQASADAGVPPTEPATAQTSKVAAPIQVRDNSAKAIELLNAHAREYASQQPSAEAPAVEPVAPATTQAEPTPAPAPVEATSPKEAQAPAEAKVPAGQEQKPVADVTTETKPPEVAEQAAGEQVPASPFVDEPAEAGAEEVATTPEEAPPASAGEPQPAPAPAPAEIPPTAVNDSLPPSADDVSVFNPLLLGLLAVAALLLGLGAVAFRKYRASRGTVEIAPFVLAPESETAEPDETPFAETLEPQTEKKPDLSDTLNIGPGAGARRMDSTLQSALQSTLQSTMQPSKQATVPPAEATQQFMAVSSPEPAMPSMVESSEVSGNDPYSDVLGEVDIHIAYGLYDEAARLLHEPLAKSPNRKDLHLKMLEVHFSANMPEEFEAHAKKMKDVLSGPNDPDWEKVCIMGRQLCPNSSLFEESGSGSGSGLGGTADLDISSMLGSASNTPTSIAKPAAANPAVAAPAAASDDLPSLDLDLSGFDLGVSESEAKSAKQAPAAAKAEANPETKLDLGNTLDFDLSDFSLDTPDAAPAPKSEASSKKEAAKPAEPADDSGLDVDLSDFDFAAPEPAPTEPKSAESAPDADADLSIDDLMSTDEGSGEGQADTRLDLARAYIDMGEPTMAETLLQEVIAQGTAEQKQEAQELLGKIGTG